MSQMGNQLTAREKQIVQMLAEGFTIRQISEFLGLLIGTVEAYRARIMTKTQISDFPGLVKLAIREGVVRSKIVIALNRSITIPLATYR